MGVESVDIGEEPQPELYADEETQVEDEEEGGRRKIHG